MAQYALNFFLLSVSAFFSGLENISANNEGYMKPYSLALPANDMNVKKSISYSTFYEVDVCVYFFRLFTHIVLLIVPLFKVPWS